MPDWPLRLPWVEDWIRLQVQRGIEFIDENEAWILVQFRMEQSFVIHTKDANITRLKILPKPNLEDGKGQTHHKKGDEVGNEEGTHEKPKSKLPIENHLDDR